MKCDARNLNSMCCEFMHAKMQKIRKRKGRTFSLAQFGYFKTNYDAVEWENSSFLFSKKKKMMQKKKTEKMIGYDAILLIY